MCVLLSVRETLIFKPTVNFKHFNFFSLVEKNLNAYKTFCANIFIGRKTIS